MIQKSKSKVLIFGYGSVGKKYTHYFLKKKFDVIIFDPFVKINNSKITIIRNYKQLNKFKKKIDYSVICSLAGDHFSNFVEASNLGIKNILMEKPLTNSFNELNKIKNIIKKKEIKFHSNHSWELYKLETFLENTQLRYNMGKPLTFLSFGGAFCISTGAIHFFNIIRKIYKIKVKDMIIFSNLYQSNINPRSNIYKTFGGVVSLSDGEKKNIIFNYSNYSKIRTTQTLIYKFHKIDFFIDGTYHLYRTDKKNDHKKITFLEDVK
ncbi:Gfo/Idh/MocA family oxidoreductase, partial [Candidatus Pelagibacter sp.]|nr:Gfo/Idh/MocA family oxidoreductase [Candidatus Pelagibacter sp.]